MVSQFSGLSGVTLLSAAQSAREPVQFAARIASQLWSKYEELSDAWAEAHGGKETLFTDEAQSHLYGQVAGVARAFNITPMYCGKNTIRVR